MTTALPAQNESANFKSSTGWTLILHVLDQSQCLKPPAETMTSRARNFGGAIEFSRHLKTVPHEVVSVRPYDNGFTCPERIRELQIQHGLDPDPPARPRSVPAPQAASRNDDQQSAQSNPPRPRTPYTRSDQDQAPRANPPRARTPFARDDEDPSSRRSHANPPRSRTPFARDDEDEGPRVVPRRSRTPYARGRSRSRSRSRGRVSYEAEERIRGMQSPNPAEGQGRAFPTPGAEERGRTYPVPRAGGRTYPVPRAAEGTTYQVPPLAEERARTASVPLAGGRTYTVPLAEELGRTYPIPPPEELRRPFYPARASTSFEGEEWRRANSPPQSSSSYTTPGNPPFPSAPQASAPYTTIGNPPYSSFPQASSYTTMGNPPYSTAPPGSASYATMGNPPYSSFPQASSYAMRGNPPYSSAPQATAAYTTTPPHWQDTTMPEFRGGLGDDEDPRLHALRGHMIQITNSLLKLEGDLIHLTEQVQKFQQERREKESIRDDLLRKLQNAGMRNGSVFLSICARCLGCLLSSLHGFFQTFHDPCPSMRQSHFALSPS
ncbi:hypothetical protein BT69DRAFT_987404 [Atractiella rhizophila]|nr:hypothetical protein BT69DRAFT_987404 [Atractiella rhizophila]